MANNNGGPKAISQSAWPDDIMTDPDRETGDRPLASLTASLGRPVRVLVAEDTPANQKVVKAILGKRGHWVEIVDNGRDALHRVQANDFDVVLMDAQMPTMNGLQATAAIRQLPNARRARVPIIAMTAHVMRDHREACLAAGMDDYLPKPIDAAELVQRVERYAARRWARDGNAPTQIQGEPIMSAPGGQRVLDVQAALERFGGNDAILHEMIRLFQQDAPELRQALRAGLDASDSAAVAKAAHNLRGVVVNFDAVATAQAARQVEEAADEGDLGAARSAAARLESELERLLQALASIKQPD
jgi:CheY-like chemotaxis protein/HPt (histidine-containing phosphotransfer) domain-containing protein